MLKDKNKVSCVDPTPRHGQSRREPRGSIGPFLIALLIFGVVALWAIFSAHNAFKSILAISHSEARPLMTTMSPHVHKS